MKLLKEMVTMVKELDADGFAKTASKILTRHLKGKKVNAFGPKGRGLWGESPEVKTFKITSVDVSYVDEDHLAEYPKRKDAFASIDIGLEGYHSKDSGLIYTDKVFIDEIKKLLKATKLGISIDYSEQGMQHDTAVNLDSKLRISDFL